jgi:hypothetical protein
VPRLAAAVACWIGAHRENPWPEGHAFEAAISFDRIKQCRLSRTLIVNLRLTRDGGKHEDHQWALLPLRWEAELVAGVLEAEVRSRLNAAASKLAMRAILRMRRRGGGA